MLKTSSIETNFVFSFLRALERKVQRLEHARGDAKGWFYRPDMDHLPALEYKKSGERSDGYSAIVASRDLPPPRTLPPSPSN